MVLPAAIAGLFALGTYHGATLGLANNSVMDALLHPLFGLLTAIVLLRLLTASTPRPLPAERTLAWFGTISFGLYLWHYPILDQGLRWTRASVPLPSPVATLLAVPVLCAAAVAAATALVRARRAPVLGAPEPHGPPERRRYTRPVAVPKIVGIETEYGVTLRGAPDPNPVVASSLLINGYVEQRRVGWDFEDESPGRDARGFARDGSQPPEVETHLVNAVLTNGARYYVDHAHPEYSTPECSDPLQAVLYDKAGERILARSMDAARRLLPAGQEIVVYKNNSDGKGNSYGCHENYLVDRNVPFAMLVRNLIPWFVTRQVFTGAGKVGAENGADAVDYQMSQRADFFEEEVGLETTLKRPIVNTRDEPHADPQKYRRLHVIVGDANLCEVATFLKCGTTAIVLAMVEDGFIDKDLSIANPVPSMRAVSHDASMPRDRRRRRPRRVHGDRAAVGVPAARAQVRGRDRPRSVRRRRDRRRRARPLGTDAARARTGSRSSSTASSTGSPSGTCCAPTSTATTSTWDDPKLELLAVQYHDVRPGRSLYERLVRGGQGRTPRRRGRRVRSHVGTAAHHAGVFPRSLPRVVGRLGGGRELGQSGARRRIGPTPKNPDDGADAW